MTTRVDDVIQLCCEISADRDTWTKVVGASTMAGGGVVIGGLLLGPAGILVGKNRPKS